MNRAFTPTLPNHPRTARAANPGPLSDRMCSGGPRSTNGSYSRSRTSSAVRFLADRPDRFEPRPKKRRKDYCGWFTMPRAELKRKMAEGTNKK
jgi:hypothetical protein